MSSTTSRLRLTPPAVEARRSAPVADPVPVPQPQPAPAPGAGAAEPAALSGVRLAAKTFRSRKGTKLRFQLSAAADVVATIARPTPGRRSGGKCSVKAKRGKRCTAQARVETMRIHGHAGANSVAFGRRLKPGRYTVKVAIAGAKPVNVVFRVRR